MCQVGGGRWWNKTPVSGRSDARPHVAAPLDHAREEAKHVLQRTGGGARHRRAKEAAGGMMSMPIGAVKGKGKKEKDVESKVKSNSC